VSREGEEKRGRDLTLRYSWKEHQRHYSTNPEKEGERRERSKRVIIPRGPDAGHGGGIEGRPGPSLYARGGRPKPLVPPEGAGIKDAQTPGGDSDEKAGVATY